MDASVIFRYDPTFRADHGGVRSMAFNAAGTQLTVSYDEPLDSGSTPAAGDFVLKDRHGVIDLAPDAVAQFVGGLVGEGDGRDLCGSSALGSRSSALGRSSSLGRRGASRSRSISCAV